MTWIAPEIERRHNIKVADERTALESWLTYHRDTLLQKCSGLTGEQLKLRSVEPSSLSLLGLVRHMAEVERWWFRRNFGKEDVGTLYCPDSSPDGDFDDIAEADAEADFDTFRAEVAAANAIAAGRSLDETFTRRDTEFDLRWVYIHMIEEYARHNGHADLIRERIDGVTGQ